MKKCLLCNKEINEFSLSSLIEKESKICKKCYGKLKVADKYFFVNNVLSYGIFKYDGLVKDVILQIKMGKDIELARELLKPYKNYLHTKYSGFTLVLVPSSKEKNLERGFNVIEEIFKTLNLPIEKPFVKLSDYKQSDHHYFLRSRVAKEIKLVKKLDKHKKYLLVDDIVTSKQTLKACVTLLQNSGIKKLKCLVLIYNHRKNLNEPSKLTKLIHKYFDLEK